jgi:hypothetical protein
MIVQSCKQYEGLEHNATLGAMGTWIRIKSAREGSRNQLDSPPQKPYFTLSQTPTISQAASLVKLGVYGHVLICYGSDAIWLHLVCMRQEAFICILIT